MSRRHHDGTRLLVAGDINADIVLRGDVVPKFVAMDQFVAGGCLTVGGSAAITAMGAARLGIPTSFVGSVGDDPVGQALLDRLRGRGIDVDGCVRRPGVATGFSVILQPDDGSTRAILTHRGAIACPIPEENVATRLTGAAFLHLGGLFTQAGLLRQAPALLRLARQAGVTTSLDPNADAAGGWDALVPLIPLCDVFLPNEEEWNALSGSAAPRDGTAGRLVVVKQGSSGATAIQGGVRLHAAVPDLDVALRDTVGAGDSFDAGLILGLLENKPLEQTLAMAVTCGTYSLRALGGVDGQATGDELEQASRTTTVEQAAPTPSRRA